jgi:putative transcriptional regulator
LNYNRTGTWWCEAEMAIRVKLDLMVVQRGMTLTELAERIGITLPNLSVLKTNKARGVRFKTLNAICRELNCQPGDLLEYVDDEPNPDSPAADTHS